MGEENLPQLEKCASIADLLINPEASVTVLDSEECYFAVNYGKQHPELKPRLQDFSGNRRFIIDAARKVVLVVPGRKIDWNGADSTAKEVLYEGNVADAVRELHSRGFAFVEAYAAMDYVERKKRLNSERDRMHAYYRIIEKHPEQIGRASCRERV
jgi:hypothetical protein